MDCGREGKDTKRGRQGSCGMEGRTGERCRVRKWDCKVRKGDMKGLGGVSTQRRPNGRKMLVGERGRYHETRRVEKLRGGKAKEES